MGDEAYNDEVLIKYRSLCDNVVQEFNGHIVEEFGDGIVAYFGSPEAHEDEARNAVSSALRIVEEREIASKFQGVKSRFVLAFTQG